MIRLLTAAIIAIGVGFGASAAEPENTLMIEVAGQANGVIEIELLPELAPAHVERIKILARDGVYNDVVFHRVIQGFMAQTGDVKFGKREGFKQRYAGQGGSNYPDLPAEFSSEPFVKGVVGMARSTNPNSANSQFFIMFAPAPNLNGQYTVFGRIVEGQDVVDNIKLGSRSANGAVSEPDVMKRVWIKADG
jgi:cyclophilin family peptidyl-prolyl cis-trans isomerase